VRSAHKIRASRNIRRVTSRGHSGTVAVKQQQ
jgi:hypothetical protein